MCLRWCAAGHAGPRQVGDRPFGTQPVLKLIKAYCVLILVVSIVSLIPHVLCL